MQERFVSKINADMAEIKTVHYRWVSKSEVEQEIATIKAQIKREQQQADELQKILDTITKETE